LVRVTVYVDNLRIPATVGRTTARWSHLVADTDDELHAFAARLGLRRSWAQYPGTPDSHYDVTDTKRRQAIALGAVPITLHQLSDMLTQRYEEREGGRSPAGPSRASPASTPGR